jgi:hypothetical protein
MLIPSLIWNKPLMALPMEWCQQIYLFIYVFFIRKSTINFLIIVTIHDSLSKCFVVSKYQPKITNLSVICKILIVSTLLNWFQSMAPSISSGDETCLRWGFLLLMGSIPGLLVVVCVSLSHAIKVPFLSHLSAWRWWASESK